MRMFMNKGQLDAAVARGEFAGRTIQVHRTVFCDPDVCKCESCTGVPGRPCACEPGYVVEVGTYLNGHAQPPWFTVPARLLELPAVVSVK